MQKCYRWCYRLYWLFLYKLCLVLRLVSQQQISRTVSLDETFWTPYLYWPGIWSASWLSMLQSSLPSLQNDIIENDAAPRPLYWQQLWEKFKDSLEVTRITTFNMVRIAPYHGSVCWSLNLYEWPWELHSLQHMLWRRRLRVKMGIAESLKHRKPVHFCIYIFEYIYSCMYQPRKPATSKST